MFLFPAPLINPGGLDTDIVTWAATVVTNGGTASAGRKTLFSNFATSLKSDGIWTKLDRLWVLSGENTPSALTDIIAAQLATAVNSPTFVIDRGYSTTSTDYINTNFNSTTAPSPKFTRNSASMFAWSNTATAVDSGIIGIATNTNLLIPYGFGPFYFSALNSTANQAGAVTDGRGLFCNARPSSTNIEGYRNGTQIINVADASTAPANANIIVLGAAGAYSGQCSACGFGQYLSSTEQANFYTHFRTLMTGIGVP